MTRAGGARNVREILRHVLAHPLALGLPPAALEVGDHALERLLGLVRAHAVVVDEADRVIAGTVEDRIACLLAEVLPLGVEGELVDLGERFERLRVVGRGRARPRGDRAAPQGQIWIRDHQVGVDPLFDTEPAAGRTGTERVVEREQPRLDFRNRKPGHRAGKLFREQQPLGAAAIMDLGGFLRRCGFGRRIRELDHREPVGELERGLERLRETLRDVGAHHDAVDHHVDIVVEFLVERRRLGDLVERAVDLDALKPFFEPLGQFLAVLALAAACDRRQQVEPRTIGQRQHPVDHLRHGLALDRQAGRRRVGDADARPEKPHVVVDLGDGSDRRARVARGRLLLDRDCRREAVDLIDVRLLHHFEELARVGGERLDVAALALGIDRVERERGLARARQAGEHDQLIARQLDVDILEIVLARAANGDHASVAALVKTVGHHWFPRFAT
jgi:hypothetical protein